MNNYAFYGIIVPTKNEFEGNQILTNLQFICANHCMYSLNDALVIEGLPIIENIKDFNKDLEQFLEKYSNKIIGEL
jgi:hypothetical protein